MQNDLRRALVIFFVFGATVAAHADNVKLVCDVPAATGEANGNTANIRADKYSFEICEGCRVYTPRDELEAYYAKNHIKPAVWHITDTKYVGEEDNADQFGNILGHEIFTIFRSDGSIDYEYTWNGARAISHGQCQKFVPKF
jgi:hypothetical protein